MMKLMPLTSPRPGRGPREDPGVLAERITRCARASFAASGWGGTTIRGVARAADVDPALVHYYFPSKVALLDAAMVPPTSWLGSVSEAITAPLDTRGEAIVRSMLRAWTDPEVAPVLRAIILTAAHVPAARDRLRFIVTTALVGATAEQLDGEARLVRAALVASQVIGLAVMRHVWEVEPLRSMDEEQLVALVAPTVQGYLAGPIRG